jgi:PAS domain S-box-containing protein
MMFTGQRRNLSSTVRRHWLLGYILAICLFGVVLGLSLLLTELGVKVNLTIPIVVALVATAWYGGLGPGILLSILFQGTTILYSSSSANLSPSQVAITYFSVFSLYVFLAFVISRLRRTQDHLASQRDLLKVTLNSIGDGVIATNEAGSISFMNPAAEDLTGWREGEARGENLSAIFRSIDEDKETPRSNPVDEVLATGRTVGPLNHTLLVSKDGTRRPIDEKAAPIKQGDALKGVVLVFSDVSERKEAERSRRQIEIMQTIVDAQEAERHRIARDLHDQLGQRMTALRLRIKGLTDECAGMATVQKAVMEVQDSALQIDRDISFLSWELKPTELEMLGLVNALRTFVREWSDRHAITAVFHSDLDSDSTRFPLKIEVNLYRIVQEALNNVLKHSSAGKVNVILQKRDQDLVLIIEDDGQGFEAYDDGNSNETKESRGGLIGMRDRAALLNGLLEIESNPGSGTTIWVKVPIEGERSS